MIMGNVGDWYEYYYNPIEKEMILFLPTYLYMVKEAIRVDGITISDANLEHLNLILNEDDSYMKEYVNDQEGEIYAIEYQKIKE